MIRRSPLRIGQRLALAFASLLALQLALAGFALDRLHGLSKAFEQLADEQLKILALTAEAGSRADVSARKLALLISAPREQRLDAYGEIDAAQRSLDATMAELARRLPDIDRQSRFQALEARLIEYRLAFRATVDFIEAGDLDGARRMLAEQTDDALTLMARARDDLMRGEQALTAERAAEFEARLTRDRRIVLALCLAALAAGVLFAVATTRRIVRPLARAESAAQRLALGEYATRVEVDTQDEVGRVSAALNVLAEAVAEREARLLAQSGTDTLTGLPQRTRFVVEGAALIEAARSRGSRAAVLCFDIDRLKTINAILGFDAGDAVIIDAAARLVAVVGDRSRVARLAGGTFAALVVVNDADQALALADSLRTEVEHKVAWEGQALDLSITAGLALCPDHADTLDALLRNAEQALFEAKRLHLGLGRYAPPLDAVRRSHLSLLSDLQDAMRGRQLRQFLQPKLSPSGEVIAAEALVRWCHPERGWVSPAEFVPFAERTGRIRALTDWMLERAVRTLARWQREGVDLKIAVNVSTQDVQDTTLPRRVGTLLRAHGVPPHRLQLELTETGLMEGGPEPIQVLRELRDAGIWLALDDFGTGHSSLAYLQSLPVHELKVDRSFITGVHADARRRELLMSIIRLGHSLGLKVTAEGVETHDELSEVRRAGCDLIQGFVHARPMDTPVFDTWRRGHRVLVSSP